MFWSYVPLDRYGRRHNSRHRLTLSAQVAGPFRRLVSNYSKFGQTKLAARRTVSVVVYNYRLKLYNEAEVSLGFSELSVALGV